jgi:hypothetical protein
LASEIHNLVYTQRVLRDRRELTVENR